MRCDQYIGLTNEAKSFLQNNTEDKVCPHCNQTIPTKLEVIGCYNGMFMEEYSLFRHPLTGGGYADEYLQASPWSSGPCFFIGLQVFGSRGEAIKVYAWSEEDINNC